LVAGLDLATLRAQGALGEGQAQAGAAGRVGSIAGDPVERLEDPVDALGFEG